VWHGAGGFGFALSRSWIFSSPVGSCGSAPPAWTRRSARDGDARKYAVCGAEKGRQTQIDQIDASQADRHIAGGDDTLTEQLVEHIEDGRLVGLEDQIGNGFCAFGHVASRCRRTCQVAEKASLTA
jgi:hypothetical protein